MMMKSPISLKIVQLKNQVFENYKNLYFQQVKWRFFISFDRVRLLLIFFENENKINLFCYIAKK